MTVTDDVGRSVALPAPARRVFSTIPSMTELIAALDPDVIVARTRWDRGPEVAHLPSVGDPFKPNLEVLARLRPVVAIVGAGVEQRFVASLTDRLGIPVYKAGVNTIDDIRSHTRRMGVLLGRQEEAAALVDSLDLALQGVAASAAGRERPSIYYSVGHDPPTTAGAGTFIHQIMHIAGGRNVFGDLQEWPQVSLESIVLRDPDVLVIPRGDGGWSQAGGLAPDGVPGAGWPDGPRSPSGPGAGLPASPDWLDGPGWRELTAVRERRVLFVHDDLFNRPGPRLAEAARLLASLLHGS